MTVLVVDDSPTVREEASTALREAGLEVDVAVDGVEGVAKIMTGEIDCVVCDVNMPNKNGIKLVEEVKADPRFTELPILMLTTVIDREHIVRARAAGACAWIVKPFDSGMLAAAVKKLLSDTLQKA